MGILQISEYTLYNKNCQIRQHQGIGAYTWSDIEVLVRSDLLLYQEMLFEPLIFQLRLKPTDVYVMVLYRPPSGFIPAFMDLLEKQLEKLPTGSHSFFLLGYFNIDLQDMNLNTPMDFLQLCMSYNLFPTINILYTCYSISVIFTNLNFLDPGVIVRCIWPFWDFSRF